MRGFWLGFGCSCGTLDKLMYLHYRFLVCTMVGGGHLLHKVLRKGIVHEVVSD